MGHAGAIISGSGGSVAVKRRALAEAGVHDAESPEHLLALLTAVMANT
jgi:succinyl-CoA synthetase alpha subunit